MEPVADVRQPFLRAEGTVLRVSGRDLERPVELQSYNYDDTDLGTNGQPRTMSVLWEGEPHFYRKERVLVLYVGDEKAVLELLTELLGPPFAGDAVGGRGARRTSCGGRRVTLEVVKSLQGAPDKTIKLFLGLDRGTVRRERPSLPAVRGVHALPRA